MPSHVEEIELIVRFGTNKHTPQAVAMRTPRSLCDRRAFAFRPAQDIVSERRVLVALKSNSAPALMSPDPPAQQKKASVATGL